MPHPSPSPSPLLTTEAVTFTHHHRPIVDSVSLTVAAQDFITIVGPNGAGKTTLLKLLLGILPASHGKVWRRRGVRLGYMPQRFQPSPNMPMTVERFLALTKRHSFWQQWQSHTTDETNEATAKTGDSDSDWEEEVVGMSRLAPLLDNSLHALSGGEMQQVLLAAALIHRPHILVLDEPAQNLDVSGRTAFYRQLETLYKTHSISILMVSHDLHMVMASTKRVVCLYGHVCCSGAPQAVATHPEFLRLFGETMAVYLHDHDHTHDHTTNHTPPPARDTSPHR